MKGGKNERECMKAWMKEWMRVNAILIKEGMKEWMQNEWKNECKVNEYLRTWTDEAINAGIN